ncbi:MAG: MerR family transcriptional regulator [Sarcina sp.]
MKDKFSIGQVSKLFNVNIGTLRYYDSIGILSPKVNQHNNYREYDIKDLYVLSLILGARYLEISINDIKENLNHENLDFNLYLEFIQKQEIILKEKIEYLNKIKSVTSKSKENILLAKNWSNIKVEDLKLENIKLKMLELIETDEMKKAEFKRFSKSIELENEVIDYFMVLNKEKLDMEISPLGKYIFFNIESIEPDVFNKLTSKYKKNIRELEFNTLGVCTKFLGCEVELQEYIKNVDKHINSSKEIFIKFLSFLPTKEDTICFCEIIFLK